MYRRGLYRYYLCKGLQYPYYPVKLLKAAIPRRRRVTRLDPRGSIPTPTYRRLQQDSYPLRYTPRRGKPYYTKDPLALAVQPRRRLEYPRPTVRELQPLLPPNRSLVTRLPRRKYRAPRDRDARYY